MSLSQESLEFGQFRGNRFAQRSDDGDEGRQRPRRGPSADHGQGGRKAALVEPLADLERNVPLFCRQSRPMNRSRQQLDGLQAHDSLNLARGEARIQIRPSRNDAGIDTISSGWPPEELWSNVVDGGASGGVLDVGLAVEEAHAPDHLAEPGRAVQPAPATLCAQAQPEDHGQRRLA